MTRSWSLKIAAVVAAVSMAASVVPLEARSAKGTRSGKASASSSARGTASGAARGARSAPTRRAQGRATYGHRLGVGRVAYRFPYWGYGGWYGPYDPWYRYPYWSVGLTWGWPYGYWYPPAYAALGEDEPPITTPATVETDIRPRKAVVLLDGVEAGYAKDYDGRWDVLRVPPGTRKITFVAEGYRTLEVTLHSRAGRAYVIEERLAKDDGQEPELRTIGSPARAREARGAPLPPATRVEPDRTGLGRGFLRIEVTPDDAAVYLDGEFLANAGELRRLHGAIAVAAGEHLIEVVRPGFATRSERVDVSGDGTIPVAIELEPEP